MSGAIYHIYCDESCTEKGHSHMVFGGVMARTDTAQEFRNTISQWRDSCHMRGEMKWTKITRNKYQRYLEFTNHSLECVKNKAIMFRSVVFEHKQIDYRTHHKGNKNRGYCVLTYEFLFNAFAPFLNKEDRVIIFPDEKLSSLSLSHLRDVLNTAIRAKRQWSHDPIRKIQPVDSTCSELMQMNDILMGAVGHHNNNRHLVPGTRPEKIAMAQHIAEQMGLDHLSVSTPREMTHFNVWQFQFGKKKKAP